MPSVVRARSRSRVINCRAPGPWTDQGLIVRPGNLAVTRFPRFCLAFLSCQPVFKVGLKTGPRFEFDVAAPTRDLHTYFSAATRCPVTTAWALEARLRIVPAGGIVVDARGGRK